MFKRPAAFFVRFSTCERHPVLGWKPDTRQSRLAGPYSKGDIERKTTLIMARHDVLPGSVEVVER